MANAVLLSCGSAAARPTPSMDLITSKIERALGGGSTPALGYSKGIWRSPWLLLAPANSVVDGPLIRRFQDSCQEKVCRGPALGRLVPSFREWERTSACLRKLQVVGSVCKLGGTRLHQHSIIHRQEMTHPQLQQSSGIGFSRLSINSSMRTVAVMRTVPNIHCRCTREPIRFCTTSVHHAAMIMSTVMIMVTTVGATLRVSYVPTRRCALSSCSDQRDTTRRTVPSAWGPRTMRLRLSLVVVTATAAPAYKLARRLECARRRTPSARCACDALTP